MRFKIAAALAIMVGASLLPIAPAVAASSYEVHYVPYQDEFIRVEIKRDTKFDADKQPVILTASPYYSGTAETASDSTATCYNPRGYARAAADVLGTRGSTGCWDYGGRDEALSTAAVVNYLSGLIPDAAGQYLTWSSGKVGMTGTSYNGTTANMVAALGSDVVPGLTGIIPVASISRWYGYAFNSGVRYAGNSKVLTDEGLDTPLLFDFQYGRTLPESPNDPYFQRIVQDRAGECAAVEHTMQGYSRTPDYGQFWRERDYLKDADKVRAAVLVVHGWQDYNVKQQEGTDFFEALPVDDPETEDVEGVPFKMMWMTQSPHANGSGPGYQELVDAFWAQTLMGEDRGLPTSTPVNTLGRTSAGATSFQAEESWPPPNTQNFVLNLGRSFDPIAPLPSVGPVGTKGEIGTLELAAQNDGGGWAHVDNGAVTEEVTLRDPMNRETLTAAGSFRGHGYYSLYHESATLKQDVRIVGSALLDVWVNASTEGQHLTPLLVEVMPGGVTLVERGFLNLSYRDGLTQGDPASGWMHGVVRFLPQDYTFKAGNRIGLILQGSNTVWAVPGAAGMLSYAMGPVAGITTQGTRLILPVVGRPSDPTEILDN